MRWNGVVGWDEMRWVGGWMDETDEMRWMGWDEMRRGEMDEIGAPVERGVDLSISQCAHCTSQCKMHTIDQDV